MPTNQNFISEANEIATCHEAFARIFIYLQVSAVWALSTRYLRIRNRTSNPMFKWSGGLQVGTSGGFPLDSLPLGTRQTEGLCEAVRFAAGVL